MAKMDTYDDALSHRIDANIEDAYQLVRELVRSGATLEKPLGSLDHNSAFHRLLVSSFYHGTTVGKDAERTVIAPVEIAKAGNVRRQAQKTAFALLRNYADAFAADVSDPYANVQQGMCVDNSIFASGDHSAIARKYSIDEIAEHFGVDSPEVLARERDLVERLGPKVVEAAVVEPYQTEAVERSVTSPNQATVGRPFQPPTYEQTHSHEIPLEERASTQPTQYPLFEAPAWTSTTQRGATQRPIDPPVQTEPAKPEYKIPTMTESPFRTQGMARRWILDFCERNDLAKPRLPRGRGIFGTLRGFMQTYGIQEREMVYKPAF